MPDESSNINFNATPPRKRLAKVLATMMNKSSVSDLMNFLLQREIDARIPKGVQETILSEAEQTEDKPRPAVSHAPAHVRPKKRRTKEDREASTGGG